MTIVVIFKLEINIIKAVNTTQNFSVQNVWFDLSKCLEFFIFILKLQRNQILRKVQEIKKSFTASVIMEYEVLQWNDACWVIKIVMKCISINITITFNHVLM